MSIALSVHLGATSRTFPATLAKRLGVPLVDFRRLELQLAEQCAGHTSFVPRFVDGTFGGLAGRGIRIEQLAGLVRDEILQAASRERAIIVGWVAPMILRRCAAVPNIEVWAPLEDRARRVCSTRAFNHIDTGLLEIESTEALLGEFSRTLFQADWRRDMSADLTVDASAFGDRALSDVIEAASRSRRRDPIARDRRMPTPWPVGSRLPVETRIVRNARAEKLPPQFRGNLLH